MKDYYKILGVPPSATATEIKKAYRVLAFKYHPDKNPDSPYAEAQFKEIQEAYAIVSVTSKRQAYDDERWFSGMGSKTRYQEAVTPSWLLNVSLELNASLATMDTHRISHRALQAYILLILEDAHLGVLLQHSEQEVNSRIIAELLKASEKLEVRYLSDIERKLVILADKDETMLLAIEEHMDVRIKRARWEKLLPYMVIIITMLLCMLMYWYGAL
jgi:curved DNA-binding protein CbpA